MSGPQSYAFDRFRLRTVQHELLRDGKPVALEPKAFALLSHFLEHRGELMGRDTLLDTVWGHRFVTPGVLSRSVAQLRKALGDDSEHPRYIQTVHALGYRFIAPVTRSDETTAPEVEAPIAMRSIEDGEIEDGEFDGGEAAPVMRAVAGSMAVPVAVLPFANMSGDPEQAYFSDGITEDIITELSRWRMLAVRSRAATFRFRGAAVDVQQVAQELRVRFIVEGSVRRMGDRVRITAQLIEAEGGSHIWAEKYDRALADIFAVQDELVRTIVSTLVGRVQARGAEGARRRPPASLVAYECVLKGNALPWDDPAAAAEAARLFEQAIALDARYALAHSLLAGMRYGVWYDAPIGCDDALEEARALAARALELDPNESTCQSIYAQVCHLRREFDLCSLHIRRAVELNPTNQWNVADMGMMLIYLGQADEALAWFQRAREVDPYFDVPWYWREYALAYLLLHRYDEAAAMFNHLPGRAHRICALKAACHALRGDEELARLHAGQCLAARPQFSIAHFLAKTPFRNPDDAAHLAAGMSRAGLPE